MIHSTRRLTTLVGGLVATALAASIAIPTATAVPPKRKPVPKVVSGTFTGRYPGSLKGSGGPEVTWTGTVTFTLDKREGFRYRYKITALTMDWKGVRKQDTPDGYCPVTASGTLGLGDVRQADSTAFYDYALDPGSYTFDVFIDGPMNYTYDCGDGQAGTSSYRIGGFALHTGRADAQVVDGQPKSPNGRTFAGHFESPSNAFPGDFTWSLVGKKLFKGPKPY